MNFKSGIAPIISVIVIVVIIAGAVVAWQYLETKKQVEQPAGEQEEEEELTGEQEEELTGEEEEGNQFADWKTYRNEEYRFEAKYPAEWEYKLDKDYVGFFIPEKIANFGPNELAVRIYSKPTNILLNQWVQELEEVKSEAELQGESPTGKFYTINGSRFYLIDLIDYMVAGFVGNAFIERNNNVVRFEKFLIEKNDRNTFKQILSTFRFID